MFTVLVRKFCWCFLVGNNVIILLSKGSTIQLISSLCFSVKPDHGGSLGFFFMVLSMLRKIERRTSEVKLQNRLKETSEFEQNISKSDPLCRKFPGAGMKKVRSVWTLLSSFSITVSKTDTLQVWALMQNCTFHCVSVPAQTGTGGF